jgi:predicted RNA-binding protein (virulence factor B family)
VIQLGEYNQLEILRKADQGLYLDAGEEGEILLPKRYVNRQMKIGDTIEVFVYLDQDERLTATTEKPLAKVGDFAHLEVAWVNEYGAFLSWGLMKDLFCPFREQKMRMVKGQKYIVHVHIDEESYRIMASAKVEHFLSEEKPPYAVGDEVNLLVWQKTELGFKVIIDNKFAGLIYDDQVFRQLYTGDRVKGYIKAVRPDGKIDVSLQPSGYQHTLSFADELLEYLQSHGGKCHLGDKSDAQAIYDTFGVSKRVFKQALGDLYKRHLVTLEPNAVKLVDNA